MRIAIHLFDQYEHVGVKTRDAIYAATLRSHNISKLISADKDFDKFNFLTRIDPQDYIPKTDEH